MQNSVKSLNIAFQSFLIKTSLSKSVAYYMYKFVSNNNVLLN